MRAWPTAVVLLLTAAQFGAVGEAAGEMSDIARISTNLPIVSTSDAELKERGLRREALGILHTPTGRIVASDFLVDPYREPFTRSVTPGDYPITLYRLTGGDPRVALAELRFGLGNPIQWELALIPGEDLSKLEGENFYGIPVDAGVSAFFDKTAVADMDRREQLEKQQNNNYSNYYDDVLASEMTGDLESGLIHFPMKNEKENVGIFSSGWGDGYYPVIWGLDGTEKPVVLVIDFFVAENADGVSPEDRYHEKQVAALSDAEVARLAQAYEAIRENDVSALEPLLLNNKINPKTYLPDAREDMQMFAISENKPDIIRLLGKYGMDGSFSEFFSKRYAFALRDGQNYASAYAELLNGYSFRQPLDPEIVRILTELSNR